jgi:putative spermidine/putrescine transport system substrate-binding protein
MNGYRLRHLALAAALLLATACNQGTSSSSTGWATNTTANAGGGMSALVSAAKSEGQLNLIAIPRDWANYGAVIDSFTAKYGIRVNSTDPYGNSVDEVAAVNKLGKNGKAPDVLDLNMTVALANTSLFAPYQVVEWADIPAKQKNAGGLWYQDYGGFMSIGYDSSKVPSLIMLEDLLGPAFKGRVALKGDPMQDDTALSAVMMVSLAEGGSLDDIGPGVDLFHQLKVKGNLLPAHATLASVKSGQTPVVLDWEYLSRVHVIDVPPWQIYVPPDAALGGYYAQAINKNAPHPAAARLWEEFLYSDQGQNLLLQSGERPVRLQAMAAAGSLDRSAAANLPHVSGTPSFMTPEQASAALKYLSTHWTKAIS